MQTIRLKIVEELGGKCGVCGWGNDLEVLQIRFLEERARSKYLAKNRGLAYMEVLENIESGQYGLICPTCKFVLMKAKRQQNAKPKKNLNGAWVYQTEDSPVEALGPYVWLDKYVDKGETVLVVAGDGRVYKYGSVVPICGGWVEYARRRGCQEDLGDKTVVWIERAGL
jgi:hypothetical protein